MRPIYTSLNEAAAKTALDNLRRISGKKSPVWSPRGPGLDNFVPFLEFDSASGRSILHDNAIESS